MQKENYKILLLSGGADSMFLNQEIVFDKKVFFDYGQNHKQKEFKICAKFIDNVIKLPVFISINKEVNCRNLTFILNLVSIYGDKDLDIFLGTNKEDIYKDNSSEFYDKTEIFINTISLNRVSIKTPLINYSKKDIVKKLKSKFYTD